MKHNKILDQQHFKQWLSQHTDILLKEEYNLDELLIEFYNSYFMICSVVSNSKRLLKEWEIE